MLNAQVQSDHREVDARRKLGAYYTPAELSELLSRWAIQSQQEMVLEPSFGGCGFLSAARERFKELGSVAPQRNIFGCDIDPVAFQYLANVFGAPVDLTRFVQRDFLGIDQISGWPEKFSAILANPPYIPYQAIAGDQRRSLASQNWLVGDLGGRASLWAYFVAKSLALLADDGRMALVLPGAFLHANYAASLRKYLCTSFRRCAVIVLSERIFLAEGADEETVIVLADGHLRGHAGKSIFFSEAHSLPGLSRLIADWDDGKPSEQASIGAPAELAIGASDRQLLECLRANASCIRFGEVAKVQVGLVTGANDFFVLSEASLPGHGLRKSDCVPILSKYQGAPGLRFSDSDHRAVIERGAKGFLINSASQPGNGRLQAYLETFGAARRAGVSTFKKRQIWSAPNDGKLPDAFFPVMHHEGPRLVVNDSESTCTNTVHRVYFDGTLTASERKLIAISLLTSFSQVCAELTGRRYGSGVLKHEPREAERIELLLPVVGSRRIDETFSEIDRLLRSGRPSEARRAADEFIYRANSAKDWWRQSDRLNKLLQRIRARRQPDRRMALAPV